MLLQIMDNFLKEAPRTADYDFIRQSVVILMGKLAKNMDKDSSKVKNILGQLIATLSTPSQQVCKIFIHFLKNRNTQRKYQYDNLGSSCCCRLSTAISSSDQG